MAHAYTPGLMVTDHTVYRKERRLPLKGQVIVERGGTVTSSQVVARTELPGSVYPVNVAQRLACPPGEVGRWLLAPEGARVNQGQVIARSTSFFGLFTRECQAPVSGTIESISRVTGQVMVREAPIPVVLDAFVDGTVVEVTAEEGVVVETPAAYIQGIFGIGPEAQGVIRVVSRSPEDVLDAAHVDSGHEGAIVVGGALVTFAALRRAVDARVKAIVVGGIDDRDLRDFLGYDLGVAITGNEDKGITLVVTEGFARIRMADRTYGLLREHEGRKASVSGATQIRAGVQRPEVVIPLAGAGGASGPRKPRGMLQEGSRVRVIREPHFGMLATVAGLPVELLRIETEAKVRVVEVVLASGERATLPRANIELIEE